MNLSARSVKPLLSFFGRFAAVRVRWLICFGCYTAGWLSCVAWVFTIKYAPEVALSLLAKVGGA